MSTNFKLMVLNVNFDNTYKNAMLFKSRAEQEKFFKIEDLSQLQVDVNFPVGTLMSARASYKGSSDLMELMNTNYCIIENKNVTRQKYLYYFITDINYKSQNMVELNLELDVINTYMLDTEFDNCTVFRSHFDRFIQDGENFKINSTVSSPLMISEGVNLPKYVEKVERVNLKYSTNERFDEICNDVDWLYFYFQSDVNDDISTSLIGGTKIGNIELNTKVICFPLTNKYKFDVFRGDIEPQREGEIELNFSAFPPGALGKLLNIKLSPIAPFKDFDELIILSVSGDYVKIKNDIPGPISKYGIEIGYTEHEGNKTYFFSVGNQSFEPLESYPIDITKYFKTEFTKNDIIINSYRELEPKKNSSNITDFSIEVGGQSFSYDIQKYGKNKDIVLKIFEPLVPDISRGFISIENYGEIYKNNKDGLVGLSYSIDSSYPYALDQFKLFLANNKNYYQSFVANSAIDVATGGLSGFLNGGILGAIGGTGNALLNVGKETMNRKFTEDNMKSAPDVVKNTSTDLFLNTYLCKNEKNCFSYKIKKALDIDANDLIDKMHEIGYNYNVIDKVSNLIYSRTDFNYIQAELEGIYNTKGISNQARLRFKSIFSDGIRFWHYKDGSQYDTFKFNTKLNNIEVSING